MEHNLSVTAQIAQLAIQLGVIIFAAKICGKLVQKIKIPSVLGELLAGIIIGPYLLGGIGLNIHGFESGLFSLASHSSIPVSVPLYGIATLGSIILLFMSGLETDLRMFFRYSVAGTIVGIGGVILSFIVGAGLGMVIIDGPFMDPRCLFLGILSTATSVGITARILSEKRSVDSPEGTTILAAAVIDDVLGIICLAVVMGIVAASDGVDHSINWVKIELIALKSVGIWLGFTVVGLFAAHRIAKFLKIFKSSEIFSILAFGLALLMAGFFEQVGLAMIVGAYVMGLSLSKTDIAFSIQRSLEGVYEFLVPIFFVVMGMLVDVRVLTDKNVLIFGLIYSALAVAAKIIGCAVPAYFMNFNTLGALRIGMGMIPRGEVALIIAGIGATTMMNINGVETPIIDNKLFGIAIIMTLVTTLVAPPLLAFTLSIAKKGVRKESATDDTIHTKYPLPSESIKEFIIPRCITNFRSEGFRHSELGRNSEVIHFRRESTTFSLAIRDNELDFESSKYEVNFIKTVVYETFVEIHHIMENLKSIANPGEMSQTIDKDGMITNKEAKQKLKIEKIINTDCIVPDLKATNQKEAIEELLAVLKSNGSLNDADVCLNDILNRESIASTCIGNGIALPHARTNGAKNLITAIGISKAGYQEFGDSGNKVNIVVLSLCSITNQDPYLEYISYIANVLQDDEINKSLIASNDANYISQMFLKKVQ